MKKNFTELVFILDKSSSMAGLEGDTIGGYNSVLKKQKALEGEVAVTTVLFDNHYQLLHDRINIKGVSPITEREYYVGGSTALMDAVGMTINKIINVQKNTSPEEKAEKVIFVITTDGMENASREYTRPMVKKLIEKQEKEYGWEFIFLGANIDAVEFAEGIGIRRDRAANFHADSKGIKANYEAINDAVCCMRANIKFAMNGRQIWRRTLKIGKRKDKPLPTFNTTMIAALIFYVYNYI
jgi:hypothetical protein